MGRKSRRVGGLAGLSFVATTGLLGAYVGYPGLRRAYAAGTCTVTTTADSGAGSLRQCLLDIPTALTDEITFDSGANGTITLLSDLPPVALTSSLTITGNGEATTIIDGNGFGGFRFENNHTVTVSSMTISQTYLTEAIIPLPSVRGGAALYSEQGDVVITDVTFEDNEVDRTYDLDGGAIYVGLGGDLTVTGSTFNSNVATRHGGAIFVNGGGTVSILDTTFYDNGAATGTYGDDQGSGGAIYVYGNGAVMITDSDFDSNAAYYMGGGISVEGSGAMTVTNSYFVDNVTLEDGGGAIRREDGPLDVSLSTFVGNYASNDGGAIYADGTASIAVTVADSTFQSNSSGGAGGAIYLYSDVDLSVSGSAFTSNTASGDGGAFYSDDDNRATFTNSTFTGNSADDGGALAFNDDSYGYVTGSTFDSNSATDDGGAVYIDRRNDVTFTNSTFYDNESQGTGGAIFTGRDGVTLTMNFVTLTRNTTTAASSGAIHSPNSLSSVSVSNSIVYDNAGGDVNTAAAKLTASYSLFTSPASVSPSVAGADLIFGEDPLLGALADNGGPTLTMMPAANSPVIGMADPTGAPATDQRGFSRTTNGLADMGAVEVGGVAPEPDLSQLPPSWFQATTRDDRDAPCPAGMDPSWAEWANDRAGGWTCEWVTWWDVNKGTTGGWITTPGFNVGRVPGQ